MRFREWVGATLSPLNCLKEEFTSADPELYKNPMLLLSRGLLRARSRFPEIVVNTRKREQRKESLERGLVLAKQALSQLSYTPTVRVAFLKHFSRFQNPFPRILSQWSEPLF